MCMSAPSMPKMVQPEPPKPPPPPAPPAPPAQSGAAEVQGSPENPGTDPASRKRKGRNSLRIPKNQNRGVNLPGSGGE